MTDKTKYVVGLGEVLWDVLPQGRKIGGAPANFAYHASQFGLQTKVVSAVGEDALGEESLDALSAKHLDTEIARVPWPTGQVLVSLDKEGVPSYNILEDVAWDYIPFSPALQSLARQTQAVCFGTLAQRSVVSRETIMQFLAAMPDGEQQYKVFDINLRQHFFSREVIEKSLQRANVLKINDEELVVVSELFGLPFGEKSVDRLCRHFLEAYGLKCVILTCGTHGSYVFTPHETSFMETPEVAVADTVGAGDSFTGSFVAALIKGCSVRKAHQLAVKVSAYVCGCEGAMPALPSDLQQMCEP